MIWSMTISYWLTLGLSVVAAGFLVRIFIIFHDCGHGSFFKSRRANRIGEFLTGVLVFTPYRQWRHAHAVHHASSGDLDRRGEGEIWTMTVREYQEASPRRRLVYRLIRHPLVLFIVAPFFVFVIQHRFTTAKMSPRLRQGVHWSNLAMLAITVVMSLTIGLKSYLLIQLPTNTIAALAGFWLFYVQHQFDGVEWDRGESWEFSQAAVHGSSYYKLPRILQWFSGNIGFHHIHHLSPSIPNYRLEKCYNENEIFKHVKTVTLWSSRKSLTFRLWDEQKRELVTFKQLRSQ
jgi:omega-6 fatty acid desaturase (delta-12 desaturase)